MCMVWPCHSLVDGLSKKCINVFFLLLINHDCLPIFMLVYIMLCTTLAYLMLPAALSNAVCLDNASFSFFLPLIFAHSCCFNAMSWFIDTYRVYFIY